MRHNRTIFFHRIAKFRSATNPMKYFFYFSLNKKKINDKKKVKIEENTVGKDALPVTGLLPNVGNTF